MLPHAHYGPSDNIFLLLLPVYSQLLKQAEQLIKTVNMCGDYAAVAIQDCFKSTDQPMFRDAAMQENHVILDR